MQRNKNNQQDNDRIDLSTVNKTSKAKFSLNSLRLPVRSKKVDGPLRDSDGKFTTTSGGGGLRSYRAFNWKRATPLILIVALVGGFLVYKSFATTGVQQGKSFSRSYSQLEGGHVRSKANGAKYINMVNQDTVTATITRDELLNTEYFCVNHVSNEQTTISIKVSFIDSDDQEVIINDSRSTAYDKKTITCKSAKIESVKAFKVSGKDKASIEIKLNGTPAASQIYSLYGMQRSQADDVATESVGDTVGETVLRRINAEQMIPRGNLSNQYLQQFVHTGTGTTGDNPTGGLPVTIIDPIWTQASGRWDESWPEKIKVCAITYHQLPNNETTVQLSVGAAKQYNKVQVLQKMKNLNPPDKWPKQELCSDSIPRTDVQPATPGTPGRTVGPASSFVINMKTISVCAKEGQHLSMVYTGPGSRCHTSGFQANTHIKYPPYVPYVEQYIIKKAE